MRCTFVDNFTSTPQTSTRLVGLVRVSLLLFSHNNKKQDGFFGTTEQLHNFHDVYEQVVVHSTYGLLIFLVCSPSNFSCSSLKIANQDELATQYVMVRATTVNATTAIGCYFDYYYHCRLLPRRPLLPLPLPLLLGFYVERSRHKVRHPWAGDVLSKSTIPSSFS